MSERVIRVDLSEDPRSKRLDADIQAARARFPFPWQARERDDAEYLTIARHFSEAE